MAIQVEMWQKRIKEQLFKDNAFLAYMANRDEYVIGGKIVHIPQSAGPAPVEKNRTVLPATIIKRQDTDIIYALAEYTSDPVLIPHADTVELSYNKMDSVIRENAGKLLEFVGDDLLYECIKNILAANVIETTGADAAATAPGATGNRKIMSEADIRKARVMLNKQNVPQEGRYLLVSSDMLNHLSDDEKLKYAFQQVIDLPEGVIAKYAGFNIMERSSVATLDAAGAVKVPGAAEATDDNDAAVFWQRDYLERALGDTTMFDDYGRPEYYGDIFSFLVRAGGRACREDNKGYGVIQGVV